MAPPADKKVSKGEKKDAKVKKANKVAKKIKKAASVKKAKVRRNVHFFRKKTLYKNRTSLRLKKCDLYKDVTEFPRLKRKTHQHIIPTALSTEHAMRRIEGINTLTFLCPPTATKQEIKQAVEAIHKVKTVSVRTLIRPDGKKKAFVRLSPEFDSLDVASKMHII